ncbi:protein ligase RNF26 [Seminavis robusta]|uniref:Protein ligase RNF26 n=1 Tax=Seminavis robusta TaxID=568900 RepID=A0A9N8ETK7_9STRA|nr:protein ligase RNF26 [Seminavis robusta]|eukprot:Sro1541_g280960.1 protein ligase RNF26 (296) ;mRNA; r:23113-24000
MPARRYRYPDDSDSEEEALPNNLDPSVAALLEPLGDDEVSMSLLRTRIALMKLQQARIRGNSDYAAKIMDHAIDEGARDRTAWTLLEKHMKKLESQVSDLDRNAQQQENADDKKEDDKKDDNTKTDNDEDKGKTGDEAKEEEEDEVTSEQVKKLKEEVEQEKERANSLGELLMHSLEEEIGSVLAEQTSLKDREERVKARVRSLDTTLKKLPGEHSKTKELHDQMKDVHENQCTLVNALCAVCHEQSATKAVIPCGHLCLCDECTKSITELASSQRSCPLCRGNLLSTLHIYTSK